MRVIVGIFTIVVVTAWPCYAQQVGRQGAILEFNRHAGRLVDITTDLAMHTYQVCASVLDVLEVGRYVRAAEDRVVVAQYLERRFADHSKWTDSAIQVANRILGNTKRQGISDAGIRLRDELRAVKSLLQETASAESR